MNTDYVVATGDGMSGAQLMQLVRGRSRYHREHSERATFAIKEIKKPVRQTYRGKSAYPERSKHTRHFQMLAEIEKAIAFRRGVALDNIRQMHPKKAARFGSSEFYYLAIKHSGAPASAIAAFARVSISAVMHGANRWPKNKAKIRAEREKD